MPVLDFEAVMSSQIPPAGKPPEECESPFFACSYSPKTVKDLSFLQHVPTMRLTALASP